MSRERPEEVERESLKSEFSRELSSLPTDERAKLEKQLSEIEQQEAEVLKKMLLGRPKPRESDLLTPHFSDFGNATRLVLRYGEDLLYCHAMCKWLVWDGKRWALDEGERARQLATETIRAFIIQAIDANNEAAVGFSAKCLNTHRLTNALREAQPMLAVRPDELDTDPYLLNFENGTVDLRRGDLGPALRRDRITKLIRYDYVQSSRSEVFDKFIARTFGQRVESGEWEAGGLAEFIRMSMGYSATGLTREKTTFLIWGPTDTGKSTFLTLMRDLLAEYATLIFADTLMASKRGSEDSNARADLADLRGCRLAITSETEEGQRLKESTIKRLTQGQGLYKSVRKYENPIEFRETHKLWVDTNHQPIVRGTGDDTWNRLAPIPCENRLKEAEIDRELPKKLREKPAAEAALAWIVRGAGDYLESGLTRPEPVTEARKKWRAEMDTAGTFIEENCVVEKGASAGAKDIYTRYKFWAEGRNEAAMSMTMFGRRLSERGFEKSDGKKGPVVYYGICLDTTR